jgi:hypothetical protein
MKISGIKVNCSFDLAELDLDIKDIIDVKRLEWEQRRELHKECRDCEREKRVQEAQKAGPSFETKRFVEAVVNKAVDAIREQVIDQIKGKKPKKNQEVDPDERIED